MSTNTPQVNLSNIKTYGALILPFDKEKVFQQAEVQNNPKTVTSFKGKMISALKGAPSAIKNAIANPVQTFRDLADYMNDNRDKISGLMNDISCKFSGIAVTQALIDGKVTSKEALDYLFMGFAPALGVQGSLMGYSGLNQMKDALSNGTINVGAFISGFTRTLKGLTDLKDTFSKKEGETGKEVLEFDLTISHNETYQSETPDRRVQSGQSLNEYVHNMPEIFTVNCALQEGKRYSKSEFRAILKYLRERKETVQLVLGDEVFDSLILTDFNPNHDCTKSGMDYTLSFKKITRSDIDTTTEVTIQKVPIKQSDKISGSASASGSGSKGYTDLSSGDYPNFNPSDQLTKDIGNAVPKVIGSTSIIKSADIATGGNINKAIQKIPTPKKGK